MPFRVNDLVRRRLDIPYERWALWEDSCRRRGLDPKAVFTVEAVNSYVGIRFREMGWVWWSEEWFEPVYLKLDKQLEDYL